MTVNDYFSEAVLKNGCTVEFDSGSARPLELNSPRKSKSPSKHRASRSKRSCGSPLRGFPDVPCENRVTEIVDINEYLELNDVLYNFQPQEPQIADKHP